MRPRKPSRQELRELGEGLLVFAEFMGYLYAVGAVLRGVFLAPTLLDGLVAGTCIAVMATRRYQRWRKRAQAK